MQRLGRRLDLLRVQMLLAVPGGREYGLERVLRVGDTLDASVDGVAPFGVGELFAVLDR
jgi:hypothetical protein